MPTWESVAVVLTCNVAERPNREFAARCCVPFRACAYRIAHMAPAGTKSGHSVVAPTSSELRSRALALLHEGRAEQVLILTRQREPVHHPYG